MNSQNKKALQIGVFVLVAIVVLGIGYASITAINLFINGNATVSVNQDNFIVHFIEAKNIIGTTGVGGTSIIEDDDTIASFDVTGLTKVGDYAEAKYIVSNDSNGVGAKITLVLTNSNPEYFKVTETIDDDKLQAGETTLATVRVEMIKTPIDNEETTNVSAKLVASPLENEEASGGDTTSVVRPIDTVSFASDSWSTIKAAVEAGQTDKYNIGDTKEVEINGVNYTVRLVNKSTNDRCTEENYSKTACGFVVEFADIITKMEMIEASNDNPYGSNTGGYEASSVYSYLEGELYNQLPSDLKEVIIPTVVKSGLRYKSVQTTTGYLYLLDPNEIYEATNDYGSASLTSLLDYYQGMESVTESCGSGCTRKTYPEAKKTYNDEYAVYWLRSANPNTLNSFYCITPWGLRNSMNSNQIYGVAPAFRIG